MSTVRPVLLAALAAFSACTPSPEPAVAPADAAVADVSLNPDSGDAAPDAAPDTTVVIALDPDGLRFVDTATGAARPLPFGTPEADVVRAVAARVGVPGEASRNEECGAGPLAFSTWPDGLRLAFQDGRFAGWFVGERASPRLTTMGGIGIGTRRADLDAVVVATVAPSTLGVEFAAGGLFGLLSSDRPDGRVTDLWAGVSCAFR